MLGTSRHLQCVNADDLLCLGENDACCVRLTVNLTKGLPINEATACSGWTASVKAHADAGVFEELLYGRDSRWCLDCRSIGET